MGDEGVKGRGKRVPGYPQIGWGRGEGGFQGWGGGAGVEERVRQVFGSHRHSG